MKIHVERFGAHRPRGEKEEKKWNPDGKHGSPSNVHATTSRTPVC